MDEPGLRRAGAVFPVGGRLPDVKFATGNYVPRPTTGCSSDLLGDEYRRILYIDLDVYVHNAKSFHPRSRMQDLPDWGVRD
jgi:hypothetical protein